MSETAPLISVIMPVKNNERYFPKAVESVFSQSFQDWELVIVEGFSEDSTGKLADEFAQKDSRVRVFHEDAWIYESLNVGISRSRGEYIAFLNSDDLFMPEALETAANYINEHDIDLFLMAVATATCDAEQKVLIDDTKDIIDLMPKEFVLKGYEECRSNWYTIMRIGLLNNQLNVYRKKKIKDLRFRNDIFGADYFFNLEMLPKMDSIAYAPRCLYRFNAYQGVEGMNASVGKYYSYKHMMYNEFYYKSIALFATYGCLTPNVLKMRRHIRLREFEGELGTYKLDSCRLSLEEKLFDIFRYTAELMDIISIEGEFATIENNVLATSYELINASNGNPGKMQKVCDGILAIFNIGKGAVPDIRTIFEFVHDYYNPAHVGLTILSKLQFME